MAVTIRGKTLPLPILQGGMGVGISLDRLAGAVAAAGGMGTISTAVCGFREPDFAADPKGANLRALAAQVRRAKELARGAGMVAINAMVATTQYADSIRTALRAGVDAVVRRRSSQRPARHCRSGTGKRRRHCPHRQQRPRRHPDLPPVG